MSYIYRNTKTGATITVPCAVTGQNWELVKVKQDPVEKPSTGKPKSTRKRSG